MPEIPKFLRSRPADYDYLAVVPLQLFRKTSGVNIRHILVKILDN